MDLRKIKKKQILTIKRSKEPTFVISLDNGEFVVTGSFDMFLSFAAEMYLHMKEKESIKCSQ